MKTIGFIILLTSLVLQLILMVSIFYSEAKKKERLRSIIEDALNTDGDHHKQWYLAKLAHELDMELRKIKKE